MSKPLAFGDIYFSDDDMRPPDWRQLRARQLFESGEGTTCFDDHWVIRLYKYYKARDELLRTQLPGTAAMHRGYHKLSRDFGMVHECARVYEDGAAIPYMLEALLMVRDKDIPELAEGIRRDPQFLYTFEALYFDVRSRLGKPDYILGKLLAPMCTGQGTGPTDHDIAWKSMAYTFGAEMFINLVWGRGEMSQELYDKLWGAMRSTQLRQGFRGVNGRKINDFTTHEVMQEIAQFEQIAATERGASKMAAAAATALPEVFKCMKYSVHSVAEKPPLVLIDRIERRAGIDLKAIAEGRE